MSNDLLEFRAIELLDDFMRQPGLFLLLFALDASEGLHKRVQRKDRCLSTFALRSPGFDQEKSRRRFGKLSQNLYLSAD